MAQIIAHRGASAHAPENTLGAFRLALEHQADGVEFDVRMSAGGVPVVCHDATMERTAGDACACADLSLSELRRLDVGSWKGPEWAGEYVPTLQEALDLIPTDKLLLIELKEGPYIVSHALRVIRESPRADAQQFIMSFDWDSCAECIRQQPSIPVLGLVPSPKESPVSLLEAGAKARAIGLRGLGISDEWLETLDRDPGLQRTLFGPGANDPLILSVWTVDSPARALAWIRLGASMLTTNDPRLVRESLQAPEAN